MKKFFYLFTITIVGLAINLNAQQSYYDAKKDVIKASKPMQKDNPEKHVVFEELTGTWCSWCTAGIAYSWLLHENYDNVHFIAIHCLDPMKYDEYNDASGLSAAPTADIDRIIKGADVEDWLAGAATHMALTPPANVSVETVWNETTRELQVNLSAYFFENVSGDYRLGGVLIEDAVTGTTESYDQSNHYALDTVFMYGFENLPLNIPYYMMAYDHVARQLFGGYGGDENSIPSTINAGETHEYSYTYTVPEEWDENYLRVIGWLTSNSGETIQNSNSSLYLPGFDNAAPKFTSIPNLYAYDGVEYTYNIFTHDTEQEDMTITAVDLPSWLSFDQLGDSAAVITGTPTAVGSYTVTIAVSDGTTTTEQTWELVVYPSGQFYPATNLAANVAGNDVTLTWDINALPDLVSFDIYRNGFLFDNTGNTATTYFDENLPAGNFTYWVEAVYFGGISEPCDPVSVQISLNQLDPPTNLAASVDENNVTLTWDAIAGSGGDPEWLRYDNDENAGSLAIGGMSVAIRWDAGGLEAYNGYTLKKIKFFIGDPAAATYQLKVWEGDLAVNELVSQPISGVVAGWNEFDLDYPVTIDGTKEYWIGYDIVGGAGASIPGYDASPQVNGYGNKAYYWDWWWDISSMSGNWNLAGWVEDAKGNGGFLGDDFTSYNIYRNDGLLTNTTETIYLDEGLENGTYEYYATAVYNEGESDPSNVVEVYINQNPGDGFALFHEGQPFAPGTTLTVQDEATAAEIVGLMAIQNNYSEAKDVMASKEIITETAGHINMLCWGLCFTPDIFVSPYPITLEAGELNENDFSGHLLPNGIDGITIIKYTFFEENNPDVSIHFFIKYIAGDPPILDPPNSLVAEVDENNVTLTWDAPSGSGGEYLRYDNDENAGSLPIGDMSVAIRWDAGGLSAYNGYTLKKIKFFIGDAGTATYKLKVWEGDLAVNELVSQPISGVVEGWNEFDLDYPVTIDGTKEYWIGYDIVGGASVSIPGYDASPQVNGYGNKAYYWNWWWDVTTFSGNWNLAGWVEDTKGNCGFLGDALLSYNIYRDSEMIGNTTETTYLDEGLGNGTFVYFTTAVYDEGESGTSNIAEATIDYAILNPPTNLTANVSGNDVNLAWTAPATGGDGEYLRYDNGENAGSLPIGDMSVAIRWDAGGLSAYNGYTLKKIKFFVGDAGTATYKLKVWEGNLAVNPLVSQPISGVVAGWNEFELDYPVTIDGTKEYWIGYDIVGGASASIPGYDASPQVNGYGNKAYYWDWWWDVTSISGNWNLAGWVEDAKGNGGFLGDALLSYNVYRDGELIGNTTETMYLDEGLENGTFEYYTSAVYDEGESEPSDTVEVLIEELLLPPSNLVLELTGNNVVLDWDAPASEELTGYNVYHSYESGAYEIIGNVTEITYIHESPDYGLHQYYITAVYSGGESEPSDTVEIFIEELLLPPSNLVLELTGNNVLLDWDAPESDELTGYNIYHSFESGSFVLLENVTETTFTHADPDHGYHQYYITAVYTGGESTPTNIVEVVITDVEEQLENSLKIYPNPASYRIFINGIDGVEKIQLINLSGQLILEQNATGKQIEVNTSEFEPGIYFVKIFSNNKVFARKLVIEE